MRTGRYHRKNIRASADNSIAATKEWANKARTRIFNMDLPPPMEQVLKNHLRMLAILSMVIGVVLLAIMWAEPRFFFVALIAGALAAAIDLAIEYKGVSQSDWEYPVGYLSFRRIPLELPILFFNCGVAAAYVYYAFSNPVTDSVFEPRTMLGGLSYAQVALIATGLFFLVQYFRGTLKSLTFGILPLAMALYMSNPEEWILVISIIPMYLDYYLELRMVKSAHITYDKYDEAVATNVAITYFPAAVLILVLVGLVLAVL